MELLDNLNACTGCTACANTCALGAITMVPNELGFAYPTVDSDICVDCGRCQKVCPKEQKTLDYALVVNISYMVFLVMKILFYPAVLEELLRS